MKTSVLLPTTLNFMVNDVCNSRCKMCRVWEQKGEREITPEELSTILRDPLFSNLKYVGVSGGEPTLRNDLPEIFRVIADKDGIKGTGLITNALVAEHVIKQVTKCNEVCMQANLPFSIMISLDGIGKVHDTVRGRKGSFENALGVIHYLRDNTHIPLSVGCTVIKQNVWHLDEVLDFCKRENVLGRFRIGEFINRLYNNGLKRCIRNFNDDERYQIALFFSKLELSYETSPHIKQTYRNIRQMIFNRKPRESGCPYQSEAVGLDSKGNLLFCSPKSPILGSCLERSAKIICEENKTLRKSIIQKYCGDCIHDYHAATSKEFLMEFEQEMLLKNKMSVRQSLINSTTLPASSPMPLQWSKFEKPLIVGWYGTETAGDKAIICDIIQRLKNANPQIEITIASLYPFVTSRTLCEIGAEDIRIVNTYSIEYIEACKSADAIVMGGGPLMGMEPLGFVLTAFSEARKANIPCIIEGCGIGPLITDEHILAVKEILRLSTQIRVRDKTSLSWVTENTGRIDAICTSDPAVRFVEVWKKETLQDQKNYDEEYFACFLREITFEYANGMSSTDFLAFRECFEKELGEMLCDIRKKTGLKPLLMPMHTFIVGQDDRDFARRFAKTYLQEGGYKIGNKVYSPQDILSVMNRSKFNLCMRFHSVLFAEKLNAPFVAIDYTGGGKIKGFLKDQNKLEFMFDRSDINNKNWRQKIDAILLRHNLRSMNVVHLCSQDYGGAGKAAYRLHKGLQAIGVDSTMLVLNKRSGDPSVKVLPNDYSKGMTNCLNVPVYNSPVWNQQAVRWQKLMLEYPRRPSGLEVFTDAVSDVRLDCVQEIQEADIINLHWVAGGMDWPNAPLAIGGKPIVWTLHDMNPFTGGCHYAGDCKKYIEACMVCPQLGSNVDDDLSHQVWKQKYDAYKSLSINIVTPSRWLGKCAADSKLFSPFPVTVIPNGFPISIFMPYPKTKIRKELNIPEAAKVILFGADSVVNARKGFAYLIEALNRLSLEDRHDIVILTFGSLPESVKIMSRYPVYNLGPIANENQLALSYSTADVFIIPSIEDNLPNTVIEAMACGVPVVGFDIGGIPDMIDHKKNGFLAKHRDIAGLIEGIDWVISSSDRGTNLSECCRKKVEEQYALEVQAKSYYELYKDIFKDHSLLLENIYSKVRTLNQQGEDLFSKGDFEGALDIFKKALDILPDNAVTNNNLGVLYYNRGGKEKALSHYKKAAELQPENIIFQKNLADFYYVELGRVEEAMQIYVKVLNAYPEDIETLLIIGHICVAMEKFDDAKDFYSRVLKIEPRNKDAREFIKKVEKCQLSAVGGRLNLENSEEDSKEFLVSAIVSTYNSESFIRGCLEDLENQTIADRIEIVVVNSGSQQNEETVVKEFQKRYSNIKYIKTDKRETVYAAWNRGIKVATGKYITNANTDDRHRKDAFEVMINILENQPEITLVYADLIITETENETFEKCTPVGYFNWMNWEREDLLNKGCFMGPQPMWRRGVHDEYGYFDDSFVTSGDYEFWLRISQTNTFLHLPVRLGLYLRSPGSIEHLNREKQREENNEIFKMYKESISSGKIIRRIETDSPQISDKKIDERREFKLKALNPDIQVSIIMPTSGQQKYIKNCVERIEKNISKSYEIIFVDNGASKGTRKWLNQSIKENSNYIMTKCPKDSNYAGIYNEGIKASTGQYILLFSNDLVVTKDWLEGMLECLQSTSDAGIVGPMSNVSRGTQRVLTADNLSTDQLDGFAEFFMNKNRNRRIPTFSIDGFCMLFRRDLVEEIGFFDEQFGHGGCEDEDFCLRALMEGRKNIIAGDVYVHQQNKKAFSRNKKYFNAKWNKADAQSPSGKKFLTLTAIEKGCSVYQRGYINNAVEILLEGIGLSPDDKQPYYALAEILLHAKNHKDAIDILNEMPQDEQDEKKLVLLGYCKEGMDNDNDAQEYTDRILSINGKFAPALNLKGILAFKQGDIKSAEDYFNRAIESDPGYGEPYTNLGAILWDSQPEKALDLFEKGFILSPTITDIVTNYHSAITASGEFERAEGVFEEASLLYPNNKMIKYQLIDLLIKQEKNAEAMNQIEEAIALCGVDDGVLAAALKIRDMLGPIEIDETKDKKYTLSLCMIVKNEEEYLARCLKSVKPVADEMIVIDTGSDDKTIEIARALGAKVYSFKWTGDFAEARNFSLSKASGNWTFHLDADEVISFLDYEAFRKVIRQSATKKVAFLINTRNYTMDVNQVGWTENDGHYEKEESATGWTPSEKVRLFRNESDIRFEYPIHELVEPSLKRVGITVKESSIPVHHYGKLNKEKSSKKVEVYYQIGRKKLDETGGDAVAIRELAIQAEIIKKHDEAIELWEKFIAIEPNVPKAYINMGISYCSLGKYEEVLETAKKAMKLEPDLKEAHYNYALGKLHIGNAGEAVSILKKLLKRLGEYPPAQFLLAAAYCCDGEKEKGINELKELQKSSIGPGLPIRCHELGKGLVSSHRHDYAIMLLEAAIDSKNSNKDVLELYSKCLEMMNGDRKTGTMGELVSTPLEERFA